MNNLVIRPVRTKHDGIAFIKLLWKIYKDDPAWVPPLIMDRQKLMDKKKNPFYKHADAEFYLAERDGVIVGRIAAIVNHNHNKEHNDKVGFFGFFESINDQLVATALLEQAKSFLAAHGMKAMRGPANPSVNDEYGLLIEGFEKPATVLMTYNPSYYPTLLDAYGLKKEKDLYAYLMSQKTVYSEKFVRANDIVRQRHSLEFHSLDMKDFDAEVERIKEVYNKAWGKNWGAVPMTDEEIEALANDLKPVVIPDLVVFATKGGKTIGFALALPDINIALKYNKSGMLVPGLWHLFTKKKRIDKVRVIVLGVLPEYQSTGAAGVLFYESAVRAKKLGYLYGEASWVLEDNVMMNRAAEAMSGVIDRKYRIYQISI